MTLQPETSGAPGRLGRHVEHDERSRAFAVAEAPVATLQTIRHPRHVPIYDQGATSSCTGNAMAGALSSGPWRHHFHEFTAVRLYRLATVLDGFPGTYPPDDTGSSGLAVAKAAQQRDWITGYDHAFSLVAALVALQTTPVIVGFDWLEGYDSPDSRGMIAPGGSVRGGHETCWVGCDMERQEVLGANSWSAAWGDSGYYRMTFATAEAALRSGGDVTVPRAS